MATNLRLRPEAEHALRLAAARTGRSQQAIIREAVDRHLGLTSAAGGSDVDALVAAGTVRRPRSPFRRAGQRISLPPGVSTADLLQREDRL